MASASRTFGISHKALIRSRWLVVGLITVRPISGRPVYRTLLVATPFFAVRLTGEAVNLRGPIRRFELRASRDPRAVATSDDSGPTLVPE